ncbi:MAG: hypothetical protein JXR66_02805, partial [Bacteroidales bacterium]|nr:hypothetical protein [Bacteroidales bacterium]
ADETELSRLFFLTAFQVRSLADHIIKKGPVESIYEIPLITGFDRSVAELMAPFINFTHTGHNDQYRRAFLNTLLSNFIISPGEADTTLAGPSFRLLTKYRFTAGRFSGGFTSDKDKGEKMFDFLSGNLAYSGTGVVRKIIAGDFSFRSGQGIHINTGIRTGLSLTSSGYMASRNEVKPYTSAGENNFFRGIAAQMAFGKAGMILFLSHNHSDATISANADSTVYTVTSLQQTGLHTTTSEIQKKDALAETAFGASLSYKFRSLTGGLTYSENRFSLPFLPDKSDPEKIHDFEGNTNRIFSAHYNALFNRLLLFGEIAAGNFSDIAMVQGITLRPSDRLTMNMLLRNYSTGYTAFHATCPGSSRTAGNEQGILGNFRFEAARYFFISAGCDITRYPWLKYRTSFPSTAKRMEIKLSYNPSENIAADLACNYRYAMLDENDSRGIAGIYETESQTLSARVRYRISENLSLLTRFDHRMVKPSGDRGMLFLQDIAASFRSVPVTIWFRYCLFSTDSWESRLYAYENDLLYSFSIPALSGRGSLCYLMVKWEFLRRAEMRIKYSVRSVMSSADSFDEKDELKMQVRMWF